MASQLATVSFDRQIELKQKIVRCRLPCLQSTFFVSPFLRKVSQACKISPHAAWPGAWSDSSSSFVHQSVRPSACPSVRSFVRRPEYTMTATRTTGRVKKYSSTLSPSVPPESERRDIQDAKKDPVEESEGQWGKERVGNTPVCVGCAKEEKL